MSTGIPARRADPDTRPSTHRLTAIYLRHHAAAASGGLGRFRSAARSSDDPQTRTVLAELASAVGQDRVALFAVMDRLQVPRRPWQERLSSWAEAVGRLKPNGTLVRRSPLTDVVELEALAIAVRGKELGWHSVRALAQDDDRLDAAALDELIERSRRQQTALETLRLAAVERALTPR